MKRIIFGGSCGKTFTIVGLIEKVLKMIRKKMY